VTGGKSAEHTYIYHVGSGLLTIENFSPTKHDVLQIDKAAQTSMTQTTSASGLMLSFGTTGSGILLQDVTTLPINQITFGQS
jgi:hypothetical protein